MPRAYLSIGSNLGDRINYLKKALEKLKQNNIQIIKSSNIIETEPYGYKEQGKFLNMAVEIDSDLEPFELMKLISKIESELGRIRTKRWGPRVIDIDIIFYDYLIINEPDLKIPHPDMQNRFFVLKPLQEIAPDFVHPVLKKTITELLENLNSEGKSEV
ncbi:MAG: 2-amino-4-hydroxy-6-hydroxymethyldihydropteridine diphosphokinase [Actinomycetota bacterium]|nr:2-amino-4-hydroxy-6-hydroxymethyldihydropteridine diphosphokinase [Actinomycetota bacterium]